MKVMSNVERISILRVTAEGKREAEDVVTRELPLTIFLNGQELVTLLCSPSDLDFLAVGFLVSEGLLKEKGEIKALIVDDQRGVVRVETDEDKAPTTQLFLKRFISSGCGRGASFYSPADVRDLEKVESLLAISGTEVFTLVREFQHHSQLYRATGGVHSAALCDTKSILVFAEDIGRHNAIDKILGQCFLKDISLHDRIITTSGRVSSEIVLKAAKRGIPMIISISAPTDLGVKLAGDLGITLIGFVRGQRMNVYTNGWRVVSGG